MIKDVKELIIYRSSLQLINDVYTLCTKLPRHEKDTIDQLRRATKSISANIAEGFAKHKSPKEFKRYLQIAMGSSDESITHLRTLFITSSYFRPKITEIAEKFKILSRQINTLHSHWVSD